MRPLLILTLILSTCSILSSCERDQAQGSTTKPQLKLEIPQASWEPIFFKSINERANLAELNDLRSVVLEKEDVEIRVWSGFGVSALSGYVIKHRRGEWSTLIIPPILENNPRSARAYPIVPKSGGQHLWERLTQAGLLTLPDSSTLPDNGSFLDGFGYVVEINMNQMYRTYMYGNPKKQKSPEARQMVEIISILYEELGA